MSWLHPIQIVTRRRADRHQAEAIRQFLLWSAETVRTFKSFRNHPPRRDADRALLVRLHASGWTSEEAARGLMKWSRFERDLLSSRSCPGDCNRVFH